MSLNILLVDDHEPFRRCLAELLERQPGLRVVAQAPDGETALAQLDAFAPGALPDVMVVDVEMPGLGGIETVRRARAAHPEVALVALSLHDDAGLVVAMLAAGAQAYALKSDPLADVARTIRDAAAIRRRSA